MNVSFRRQRKVLVLIASIFIKISGPCWIVSFCSKCSPNFAFIYSSSSTAVTYVTNYLSLFHFQKLFSTMPYSERKAGKFCWKSVIHKYKHVQQTNSNHCVNSQNEDNLKTVSIMITVTLLHYHTQMKYVIKK